jgi:PAS domain S-box-containing protein
MLYTLSGVPKEKFAQFPMPRNTQVFEPTFKGTGVVRSDDITRDPRYGKSLPHKGMPLGHLPVRSYLAVPVVSRNGDVLGGLFFGHQDVGVFTERAERVVVSIAGHAAIALDNARLHRELAETAAQFQQLANSIPQLAWMAQADGSLYWYNQRWYEYTGTTPEQMNGWGWQTVHDPAELPRVIEKWKTCLAAGTPWEDTFPLRRHDGVFRWHLSRAMPLRDPQGKVVSWFGTNTDITDQMTMAAEREQLLAAERAARSDAERVSRMKDEFLATLSHELRTPLNAILGWSHLLKRRQDEESIRQGLNVIERNARAQTQLIEDLLDMSRIVSGKIRLDVQRVDLASVVEAAVDSVMPAIEAKGLRLKKVLDPLAGPVSGDPNRLQQVVWNLLSNAVKFTPKSGRIEVLLERANSHVEITVADTGEGINPEFLPHVFERFRQADATTTRQYGGLGLGLSIVKHLIELHGGQVRAKSAGQGKGATFIIQLPLAVTRERDPTREHPTSHREVPSVDCDRIALSGVKVLIVDDEPDARMLITRLLEDCKAEVISADSADQAMRMIRDQKPDIVISDIGMPTRDGYAFMRDVRALPEKLGGRIPAIAMTAFARSEDRTRAMMAGYQVHMSKPIDPQELLATVASLMGRTGTAT